MNGNMLKKEEHPLVGTWRFLKKESPKRKSLNVEYDEIAFFADGSGYMKHNDTGIGNVNGIHCVIWSAKGYIFSQAALYTPLPETDTLKEEDFIMDGYIYEITDDTLTITYDVLEYRGVFRKVPAVSSMTENNRKNPLIGRWELEESGKGEAHIMMAFFEGGVGYIVGKECFLSGSRNIWHVEWSDRCCICDLGDCNEICLKYEVSGDTLTIIQDSNPYGIYKKDVEYEKLKAWNKKWSCAMTDSRISIVRP